MIVLEELGLQGNDKVTLDGIRELAKLMHLKKLRIQHCSQLINREVAGQYIPCLLIEAEQYIKNVLGSRREEGDNAREEIEVLN